MKTQHIFLSSLLNLLFVATQSLAQGDVTIDDLRSSSPPAFTIIGIEPKSVSRPTTPKAIATSLISSVDENGIKPDLSIEVAPYWIKKKRHLTFNEYLNPGVAQSFFQTLSLSLGTTKSSNDLDKGTKLGIGFRFQLIPGHASKASADLIAAAGKELLMAAILNTAKGIPAITDPAGVAVKIQTTIAGIKNRSIAVGPIGNMDNAAIVNALSNDKIEEILIDLVANENLKIGESIDSYIDRLKADFLTAAVPLKIQESLKNRVGWILEIAGANGISFSSNTVNAARNDKTGFWTSLVYRSDSQENELGLLGRYTKSYRDSIFSNQDLGISYSHNIKELSISAEAIFRRYQIKFDENNSEGKIVRRSEKSETYRIILNFDYKLSDSVSLTATIGKNYKENFFIKSDFLSVIGLNFSIPTKQTLPIN